MQLVRPSDVHAASYFEALKSGWSPDNVRGAAAALEELDRIQAHAAGLFRRDGRSRREGTRHARSHRCCLWLGVPIGGTFIVDVTAFTFMALFVARLGAVTSAAHQIAANVAAVMYMLPLATGTAVGVLVAQALGARDFGRARSTGVTGLLLGFGIAAISATLLALGSDRVAALYSSDDRVRDLAASLLVLVSGHHVFDPLQAVNVNTLRGYKRAVVPLMINATGMWIVGLAGGVVIGLTDVPPLRAIGVQAPLGVRGFWIAAIVGMALATLGIVAYFLVASAPSRARAYADLAGVRATSAG